MGCYFDRPGITGVWCSSSTHPHPAGSQTQPATNTSPVSILSHENLLRYTQRCFAEWAQEKPDIQLSAKFRRIRVCTPIARVKSTVLLVSILG
jgi:hypothetical protein